jgi:hypothetical protein
MQYQHRICYSLLWRIRRQLHTYFQFKYSRAFNKNDIDLKNLINLILRPKFLDLIQQI